MGNHTFANREASAVLEDNPNIIRPLNYPPETEGVGYIIKDMGAARIAVINLIGRVNTVSYTHLNIIPLQGWFLTQ